MGRKIINLKGNFAFIQFQPVQGKVFGANQQIKFGIIQPFQILSFNPQIDEKIRNNFLCIFGRF